MSVARAYAKALYEAAVEVKGGAENLDRLDAELSEWVKLLNSSKEMRVALTSPSTAAKDKVIVVGQLAGKTGISPLLRNFLTLLARKERLGLLAEIHESFGSVRLETEGGILGRVVSADPLAQSDLEVLARSFSQKLGKRVAFRASTDPSLLAGVQVTVSGVTYDGSLRSQLQRLRDQLVHGAGSAQ